MLQGESSVPRVLAAVLWDAPNHGTGSEIRRITVPRASSLGPSVYLLASAFSCAHRRMQLWCYYKFIYKKIPIGDSNTLQILDKCHLSLMSVNT